MKKKRNIQRIHNGSTHLRRLFSVALAAMLLICYVPLGTAMGDEAAGGGAGLGWSEITESKYSGTEFEVTHVTDDLTDAGPEHSARFTLKDEDGNEFKTFCADMRLKPAKLGAVYTHAASLDGQESAFAFALSHSSFGAKATLDQFNAMMGTSLDSDYQRLIMMHRVVWYYVDKSLSNAADFGQKILDTGIPNAQEIFTRIVTTIDRIMSSYPGVGNSVSSIVTEYDAATGKLTFGYSGFQPTRHEAKLEWSGDTDGLSVKYMGSEIASGAVITAEDVVQVEYTGDGKVDFKFTDSRSYLKSGSVKGDMFEPEPDPDDPSYNPADYQRILTGVAEFVSLTGTYTLSNEEPGEVTPTTGSLTVSKSLSGNYGDWGVNDDTLFHAKVRDSATGAYLTLTGTAPNYTYSGTSATGSTFTFSAKQPAVIVGIPAGMACVVEEIIADDANYTAGYVGNGAVIQGGGSASVTVTNTYDHGTGNLIIKKALAGSYEDWGVDESTVFRVRVKDATNNNYLLFSGAGPVYTCTGNSGSGDSRTGDIITIRAGRPVTITNLWANAEYVVEEISGANYVISYQGNGVMITEGSNSTVTVTNTFVHGTGSLIIRKSLAGSYTDWGVDESTVFTVKVRDVDNDNYLLFKAVPETDGSYWCVGNDVDGLTEAYDGAVLTELKVTAGRPVAVTNLWAGAVYEVVEADSPHCEITYIGNGAIYSEGHNSAITVVNTYEHGTGALVINKKLAGSYGIWDIDDTTEFFVRVKDSAGGYYLLFDAVPEADGSYTCIGSDLNGPDESFTGEYIRELPVTAERPLVVKALWANHVYEIEEVDGDKYRASYIGNDATFQESKNSVITVVNDFDPEDPEGPVDPGDPEEPEEPGMPGAGGVDPAGPMLLGGLALIAAGVALGVKRRTDRSMY